MKIQYGTLISVPWYPGGLKQHEHMRKGTCHQGNAGGFEILSCRGMYRTGDRVDSRTQKVLENRRETQNENRISASVSVIATVLGISLTLAIQLIQVLYTFRSIKTD